MVTLYWGYLIIWSPFYLGISCTVVVLTCFVMCGCSGNICTCIYCVFYCLYCVFCICFVYVYWFLFALSVLVQGLLPPTDNTIAVNNNNNNNNNNNSGTDYAGSSGNAFDLYLSDGQFEVVGFRALRQFPQRHAGIIPPVRPRPLPSVNFKRQ